VNADGTAWIPAFVCIGLYAAIQLTRAVTRLRAGLRTDPTVIVGLRIAGVAAAFIIVLAVCNDDRGVPYVALVVGGLWLIWTYVLNRTRFGRHSTPSAATPRRPGAPASTSTTCGPPASRSAR
jgi:D-xylose transport system permease protein